MTLEAENIVFEDGALTVAAYQKLRAEAGWHELEPARARAALERSIFTTTARVGEEVVGCGRIVGDGQIYFYIQDVLVTPNLRGRGVGSALMGRLMNFLEGAAPRRSGAFFGLMIAPGLEDFYAKFGFEPLAVDSPFMAIWRNGH
ncbi:MAG: GNAT family N-acetyltransferase [Acidobacteriota bacterium]